jgi:hypothetical protein
MHEELSRLLAGELEPARAGALRARIAAEPELADAWACLAALPAQLAALPPAAARAPEAPPAALLAKLHAMTDAAARADSALDAALAGLRRDDAGVDALEARLDARDAGDFDPAPFAPDPREDTIDPEPFAPRTPGAPMRFGARPVRLGATRPLDAREGAAARPAAPRTVSAPAALPRSNRRAWVGLGVAAALALGVGIGATLDAPAAPARLALGAGHSVVEGDVDVRAGDLDVRVDGRVHITVTPAADRTSADAELVHIDGPSAAPARRAAARAIAPADASAPAVDTTRPTVAGPSLAGAAPVPFLSRGTLDRPGTVITLRVESGDAVIATDSGPVRVASGETRSFDDGGRSSVPGRSPEVPARGPGNASAPDADVPVTRADEALAHKELPLGDGGRLGRVVAALDPGTPKGPDEVSERLHTDEVEALLLDVETAVASAELADLDCDALPCVAVFAGTDSDTAWIDDVRDALAARAGARLLVLSAVEAQEDGLYAVAIAPPGARVPLGGVEGRLHAALDDAETLGE